ncbi:MAG: hypothetical protein GC192_20930 [Bacteroidetes bacterium]|nr:hypothetical protein [Bacteroidota bacterium]
MKKSARTLLYIIYLMLSTFGAVNAQTLSPPDKLEVLFLNINGSNHFTDIDNVDINSLLMETYGVKAVLQIPTNQNNYKIKIKLFDSQQSILMDDYTILSSPSGLPTEINGDVVFVSLGDFPQIFKGGQIECSLEDASGNYSQPKIATW